MRLTRLIAITAVLLAQTVHGETFTIGAEDDWFPYTGVRDNQPQGMSVDIVRAAFDATGTPVKLVSYPYARCMRMTAQGELAGCFNTARNSQLTQRYLFASHPLFIGEIVLWASSDHVHALTELAQLAGSRVAVVIGYEYGQAFDEARHFERVPVRRDLSGFRMLRRGRVDYMVAYRNPAQQLFADHADLQGRFRAVMTLHRPELYLSFSRRYPNAEWLRTRFDEGMTRIHANGRYAAILAQWALPRTSAPAPTP